MQYISEGRKTLASSVFSFVQLISFECKFWSKANSSPYSSFLSLGTSPLSRVSLLQGTLWTPTPARASDHMEIGDTNPRPLSSCWVYICFILFPCDGFFLSFEGRFSVIPVGRKPELWPLIAHGAFECHHGSMKAKQPQCTCHYESIRDNWWSVNGL